MRNKNFLTALFLLLSFTNLSPQGIAIGQWRDHLPYNSCIRIAEGNNKIYAATRHSLFSLDLEDNSLSKISKANILSDAGISTIAYSKTFNTLIIAYNNANIDFLSENRIYNLPDIKRKPILGSKTINHIMLYGNYAYLSCGFGIVVIDMQKKEIKDTYYIGPNGDAIFVNATATNGSNIVAVTNKGIYMASMYAANLADFNAWKLQTNIAAPLEKYNATTFFNGKFYVNLSNTVNNADTMYTLENNQWVKFMPTITYPRRCLDNVNNKMIITYYYGIGVLDENLALVDGTNGHNLNSMNTYHAYIDSRGTLWVAENNYGLVRKNGYSDYQPIYINGTFSANVYAMDGVGDKVWVASGGKNADWNNMWKSDGMFYFIDEKWGYINKWVNPELNGVVDMISVKINPKNNQQVYAGSYGGGLLEYENNTFVKRYNSPNYPLGAVTGLNFDKNGNLWISSSPNLLALTPDKTLVDLQLSRLNANLGITADIVVDNASNKWILRPRGNGICVFTDNNTLNDLTDDKLKILTTAAGNGNLPTNEINCMALDKNGELWLGTANHGVAVIYNPENVFYGGDFDAKPLMIEQDGYLQPLLEYDDISCIVVDGSNKKWIGTKNSGAYLMSADGLKEILHFTIDNSPLLSNYIYAIAINGETGEVFFGTENGIVSYKGVATDGKDDYKGEVYAYPNPVRSSYNGAIAIKGLTTNADIKITDINGNLVYETVAEGGQAIWYGRNFAGEKAQTGIYLVFCSNADGKKTFVTKIMFVN